MKTCGQCEEVKEIVKFPKTGKKCKSCKAFNLRKYRKDNKGHVSVVRKTHRDLNKEKINEQKRGSYQRHAPKIKEKNNVYYHQNAEVRKAWQRNYQIDRETANIESWLEKCRKHSATSDKKYGRENDMDLDFLLELYKKQDGKCALSGLSMTHQRDDLFAISPDRIDSSLGHIKENIQLICSGLNRAKREYSNQKALEFVEAIRNQSYKFKEFSGFNYPESTKDYTSDKKLRFKGKLRDVFDRDFLPPIYAIEELEKDLARIEGYGLSDYLTDKGWRAHKPENKPWAGKKLIWNFHPHLWKVRTQGKPLIDEIWGHHDNSIFERTLTNLIDGQTKISFERIVRELVRAGVGVPSQIHVGFAKAIYEHFGCQEGDAVYDPFAGWGGRLLAAASLKLKYEACELSLPTWAGLIRMNKTINYNADVFNIDALTFEPKSCKMMFTSPPFGSEEYIGSDHVVDLDRLLEITKAIPIRVLHVNKKILKELSPDKTIEISSKSAVGAGDAKEFLAVYVNI